MPLVACPGCQTQLQLPDGMAGRSAKCPKCTSVFQIPGAPSDSQMMPPPSQQTSPGQAPQQSGSAFDFSSSPPPGGQQPGGMPQPSGTPQPGSPQPLGDQQAPPVKKSNRFLLYGIIGGSVVLLAGAGLVFFFVLPMFLSGPSGEMRFLPDKSNMIVSARLGDIMSSPAYKKIVKKFPDSEDDIDEFVSFRDHLTDFSNEDIRQVLFGVIIDTENPTAEPKYSLIVSFKKEVGLNDTFKGSSEKTEEGKYKIYQQGPEVLCSLDSFTVAKASDADLLQDILKRGNNPKLSEEMQAAVNKVNWSNSVVVVTEGGVELASTLDEIPLPERSKKQLKSKSTALEISVRDDVTIKLSAKLKSPEAAKDWRKLIDGVLTGLKLFSEGDEEDLTALFSGVNSSVSGSEATHNWTFAVDPALNVGEPLTKQFPLPLP